MARTLKTKFIESGELNLKIVIDNYGGVLRPNLKKSKGDCSLKPAKVSFPIRFSADVEFIVGNDGRVILPEDREHQMSFDEVPPASPVVTQVDGSTGLVESVAVQEDEQSEPDESSEDEQTENESDSNDSELLYPCSLTDCPFFGVVDGDEAGCCFDSEDPDSDYYAGDVWEAVRINGCVRPEVLHAYHQNNPENQEEV